ncbi:hypothetical protein SAMN05421839_14111 [Halolactibacillus halophilus]|uniref:YtxH-like protein n=1 Tax=Halolactibacillus halophilus TaxID=306540 RepID=A0A1I5SAW2_9BACI|nr:hypothetical protein [Halolactibacillus halophilus]GEM02657.1 hypothetical protein HHA03_21890 [Halolactibacillus halophilus]SFP67697.1 hypothetical protein SAMN05421839_14111 [Halolactibacillus halophilus]
MRKKKKLVVLAGSAAAGAAAGATALYHVLKDEQKRRKLSRMKDDVLMSLKLKRHDDFPLDSAGGYDENIDNADMISEGSSFGVDYYNRVAGSKKYKKNHRVVKKEWEE